MNHSNYTRTITVSSTAEAAYLALTEGMKFWWTKPDKPILVVGDRSKFTFPPNKSFWTFEATTLEPSRSVEMICIEAMHLHEGQPKEIESEWLGTKVAWDIKRAGDQTQLRLEHCGLVPDLLCYDICEAGWDMFFVGSLKAYLDTGTGRPHSGSA